MPVRTTPEGAEKTLPTLEELDRVQDELLDVVETFDHLARRVFAVTNIEGDQDVSWEQVGQLVARATQIRGVALGVADSAGKVQKAAIVDLANICEDGAQPNVSQFDTQGTPNYIA